MHTRARGVTGSTGSLGAGLTAGLDDPSPRRPAHPARDRRAAGCGTEGKALVVIAVEVHESGPGRVRMRRIPNASADVLTEFVLDHVARGSEVHTDAWGAYNDIGRYRFGHYVTNISASGDPAHVVMPEVHRIASLL